MKSGATTAGIILQVLVGYFVYPTAVASGDSQPAINKNSVDVAHTSSAGFLATGRAAVRVEEATAAAAAAAEQTPSTAGMLELSGTLNSGHHISISMPRTATEEEILSLLKKRCDEEGVTDPNEAIALTAHLVMDKNGYKRTRFWFELGGARRVFDNFLGNLRQAAEDHPLSVLEVGSFEGGSALWFAQELLKHPHSRMVCLDTWGGSPEIEDVDMASVEDRFLWNVAKTGKADRIHAIKGDSLLSLSALVASGQSSSFDVIYVDASHEMADALADCLLSFRLLKVGGTMIIDDEANFQGVAAATAALENALTDGLQIVYRKEQVVARKTSSRWSSSSLVALEEQAHSVIGNFLMDAYRARTKKPGT